MANLVHEESLKDSHISDNKDPLSGTYEPDSIGPSKDRNKPRAKVISELDGVVPETSRSVGNVVVHFVDVNATNK